jgi:hypothetical protein
LLNGSSSLADQMADKLAQAGAKMLEARHAEMAEALGITLQDGQDFEQALLQYSDDKRTQMHLRGPIAMLNADISFHARAKEYLPQNQDEYNRVLHTKPVPRKELSGKDKDAALKLLDKSGLPHPGENQTVSFGVDGTLYMFKGDGTVWTNQGDIPISEDAKQWILGILSNKISDGQRDMSDVISNRDAMQAQYDELEAKYTPRTKQ